MQSVIVSNPKILHGEPCFAGTRVAVKSFFDHLEAGYTLTGFLEQFPSVRRDQVTALLAEMEADVLRAAVAA